MQLYIYSFLDSAAVMPSRATLFNCKCEPVFDFGTGHRNVAHFNPHGNNILPLKSLIIIKTCSDLHVVK